MNLDIQKVLHFHLAKEKKSFKITSPYAVMEKLDGWFVYIDYINGKTEGLKSSSGRLIPSLTHLNEKLSKLNPVYDYRIIFEATIPNLLFHETNGILNRKYELALDTVLNFHDCIRLDMPRTPFITRYSLSLKDAIQDLLEDKFNEIPILVVSSNEDIFYRYFKEITSNGGEGIILKNINAGYSFGKRNSDVMKIKEEITEDCIVIDVLEGEGKYKDTTGTLVVVRENGNLVYISGFTDKERELWWENPELIKGKYVEVKAMKILPDGTFREPRFKSVRDDK